MIVFSINNIIGRLHDAAIEALNKEQGGWLKRVWKRTNGIVLVNTAINEGKNGRGSVFIGGPGPFEIRASLPGLFPNEDEFKRLVGIYLQHFAGNTKINLNDLEVTNTRGKKIKGQLACQYKINLKTGIKWIPKEIPDSGETETSEEKPKTEEPSSDETKPDTSSSDDDSDVEIVDSINKSSGHLLVETVGDHYKKDNFWLNEAKQINKKSIKAPSKKISHKTIEKFINNISNENYVDAKNNLKSILKTKIQQKFEEEQE